jgi:hypothetical protein
MARLDYTNTITRTMLTRPLALGYTKTGGATHAARLHGTPWPVSFCGRKLHATFSCGDDFVRAKVNCDSCLKRLAGLDRERSGLEVFDAQRESGRLADSRHPRPRPSALALI